jgi:hypothetical protein
MVSTPEIVPVACAAGVVDPDVAGVPVPEGTVVPPGSAVPVRVPVAVTSWVGPIVGSNGVAVGTTFGGLVNQESSGWMTALLTR